MRVLLCTADGGGNVPVEASVARELVRRGHDVRVLTGPYFPGGPRSPSLEVAFSAVGGTVVSGEGEVWPDGAGQMPDITSIPVDLQMVRTMAILTPMAVPWAVQAAREIESFQPAVVLTDLITPGAAIAAEAARTPFVVFQTTVPVHRCLAGLPVPGRGAPPGEDEPSRYDEHARYSNEIALPLLNAARERVGLAADDDPWASEDRAARVVVLASAAFDFPAAAYPANFVYAGSVRTPEGDDHWENPWDSRDERPLVVVSGTTTGLAGLWFHVYQGAAQALVDLRIRGLLTLGPLDPKTLPQNENLTYRPYVPHAAVLPLASAMVTQCGHGAVMAALKHGVPLVCVPLFADQPDVAARVAHHGAGIRLPTLASGGELRSAIQDVVGDPRYRDAARDIAGRLANEDGARRAVDEIEAVAGG